ncbi:MAG: hypothetical protein K8T25_07120 [Planctomycetia bacterium]|nr:hypothetical protein [Planctomycetia bacterium]
MDFITWCQSYGPHIVELLEVLAIGVPFLSAVGLFWLFVTCRNQDTP